MTPAKKKGDGARAPSKKSEAKKELAKAPPASRAQRVARGAGRRGRR
jgi:hypothetical protein